MTARGIATLTTLVCLVAGTAATAQNRLEPGQSDATLRIQVSVPRDRPHAADGARLYIDSTLIGTWPYHQPILLAPRAQPYAVHVVRNFCDPSYPERAPFRAEGVQSYRAKSGANDVLTAELSLRCGAVSFGTPDTPLHVPTLVLEPDSPAALARELADLAAELRRLEETLIDKGQRISDDPVARQLVREDRRRLDSGTDDRTWVCRKVPVDGSPDLDLELDADMTRYLGRWLVDARYDLGGHDGDVRWIVERLSHLAGSARKLGSQQQLDRTLESRRAATRLESRAAELRRGYLEIVDRLVKSLRQGN